MKKNLFDDLKVVLYTYRWRYLKGFLMVLISNVLLIVNPLVFRQALQAFENKKGPSLWSWVPLLLVIAATSSGFKYLMRMTFISVSRDVEFAVRSKLFTRIQQQSMAFFDRHGIGELLSRLTSDISAYRDVLGPGIMYPLFSLTMVIPGFMALFSISPQLTGVAFLPVLAIPLVNYVVKGRIYTLSLAVQKSLASLSNLVQEHFSSIRIIKSYVVETLVWKRFTLLCDQLKKESLHLSFLQGSLFPFFTFLTKVITVLLVFTAELVLYQGWSTLNSADFISFIWIQSYIFFPILSLGWLVPIYERGRAAYNRLVDIYEEPIEVKDLSESNRQIPELAEIQFKKLSFTYPTGKYSVLEGINLKIAGGSFVGICGPIGAGKTTLFRLLNREYDVPVGSILINGVDIHQYPLEAFHQEMVTVEQVPFLFSKSIVENVRFGKPQATMEDVVVVSRYADFHETVLEFPEQYETLIGERGVALSGGQKLRLAMARAFLVNRSILLLDDIFSAIDSQTEKRVFQAMRENFKRKSVILITHRVSILEQLDKVVYLMDGQVAEEGTPEELKAMRGHYAALVELQRQEEIRG